MIYNSSESLEKVRFQNSLYDKISIRVISNIILVLEESLSFLEMRAAFLELKSRKLPDDFQPSVFPQGQMKNHFQSKIHQLLAQTQEEYPAMLATAKKTGRLHAMESGKFVSSS